MTLQKIADRSVRLGGQNFPSVDLWMEIHREDSGSGVDAANNRETLYGQLYLARAGSGGQNSQNANANLSASAAANIDTIPGNETIFFSSTLSYDFRASSGMGSIGDVQFLWQGYFTVEHDPDGTKTMTFAGSWTGDSNLGPGSVSGSVPLPKITRAPNAPTALTAVRVSDTEITVSWSQSHPANGQATSNTLQRRVNGGAWADVSTVAPTTSLSVSASANQKVEYRVRANNAAGSSAWSSISAAVYTTPGAPTALAAAKDASLDINLNWTPNVAYTEHEHVIEESTNGGTTWSPVAPVTGGTSTYKHVAPNASVPHTYRIRSRATSGGLTSGWATSNTVQLLAAPNKPTLPDLPDFVARERAFKLEWAHNAVDTTPQTAYEVGFSTNGGSTWTTTGKITSALAERTIAALTYAANVAVTLRVRTWGQATAGGADGAGASPWSDLQTITFKNAPVATITTPANGGTWPEAILTAALGFSQAQAATFVKATAVLSTGGSDVETVESGSLAGITFTTPVANGTTYTLTVTLLDSNGVTSNPVTSTFNVAYTLPVAAVVTLTHLRGDQGGSTQIDLVIPAPGGGFAAATKVTIIRSIDGVPETLYDGYPITAGAHTFQDTTPVLQGANVYRVRTFSALGAINDVVTTLDPAEPEWAYISTGPGFGTIIAFASNLRVSVDPSRESSLFAAAGRRKKIAQFGEQRDLSVSGSATLWAHEGSSPKEVEQLLLDAELVCYRDPTGRRMFGRVTGSVQTPWTEMSEFSFNVTEAT